MPAITFTNLYILYLLWHYQWQDCAAGSEQRAAALLTCCLPSLLPPSSNLLSPPSPFLLSHFVAHTSLSLPVPEPRSAMTLHRQNCMLIASSQLQSKPNRAEPHSFASSTTRGRATPHLIQISIEIGNLCARIMQATTPNHSQARARARDRVAESQTSSSFDQGGNSKHLLRSWQNNCRVLEEVAPLAFCMT